MHYNALTTSELVDRAKALPQFNTDPLFTAIVARLEWVLLRGARYIGEADRYPPSHYNTSDGDVRR